MVCLSGKLLQNGVACAPRHIKEGMLVLIQGRIQSHRTLEQSASGSSLQVKIFLN